MRTLVEQTASETKQWLGKRLWDGKSDHRGRVGLHVLMGGEEAHDWDAYPEADAILIGTQDMLLSRALNRGYGLSRYRWPMHFGLLNNDCLWIMDETQLMGPGLWTSAQLDWMRQDRFRAAVPCPTLVDERHPPTHVPTDQGPPGRPATRPASRAGPHRRRSRAGAPHCRQTALLLLAIPGGECSGR